MSIFMNAKKFMHFLSSVNLKTDRLSNKKSSFIYLFIFSIVALMMCYRKYLIHDQSILRLLFYQENIEPFIGERGFGALGDSSLHILFDNFLFIVLFLNSKILNLDLFSVHALYCSIYITFYLVGMFQLLQKFISNKFQSIIFLLFFLIGTPGIVNQIFLMEDNIALYSFLPFILINLTTYFGKESLTNLKKLGLLLIVSVFFHGQAILFWSFIPFALYKSYHHKKHLMVYLYIFGIFIVSYVFSYWLFDNGPLDMIFQIAQTAQAGIGEQFENITRFSPEYWSAYYTSYVDFFYNYFNKDLIGIDFYQYDYWIVLIYLAMGFWTYILVKYRSIDINYLAIVYFLGLNFIFTVFWEAGVYQKLDLFVISIGLSIASVFKKIRPLDKCSLSAFFIYFLFFGVVELIYTPFNQYYGARFNSYQNQVKAIHKIGFKNKCVLLDFDFANYDLWFRALVKGIDYSIYYKHKKEVDPIYEEEIVEEKTEVAKEVEIAEEKLDVVEEKKGSIISIIQQVIQRVDISFKKEETLVEEEKEIKEVDKTEMVYTITNNNHEKYFVYPVAKFNSSIVLTDKITKCYLPLILEEQ